VNAPASIRVATVEDAEAIARVQVASWHAAYRGLMPDAILDAFTVDVRAPRWRSILAQPTTPGRTTVLERDGRLLGFASHGPSRDEPGAGEVWALYAHPDAWSSGVGRALLEEGLAFLDTLRLAETMLWVLDGNLRAVRFYERAGFGLDGGAKDDGGLPHRRMRRRP
jgi:GNAT superfamily N-acetyltransferase